MEKTQYSTSRFSIIENSGREFINMNQVVRLMADGSCTWVYLQCGRKVLTTKNLGYYDSILPKPIEKFENTFFRIHYKHIINLSGMENYNSREKYIKIIDGNTLPIAQRRVSDFCKMLKSFNLY